MEEQNTPLMNNEEKESQLVISPIASNYLNETGKWTKFLAIMGFIMIGFIVIVGLFAGTMMSLAGGDQFGVMMPGMSFFIGFIYVVMGLIYLFPTLYLFKFSNKIKSALQSNNNDELNEALSNQKSFYKFIGIFTIVILSIYLLFGIIAVSFSAMLMP